MQRVKLISKSNEGPNEQSFLVPAPSGSGKSSVVFAGLLPHLRQEKDWLIAVFRPGVDPLLGTINWNLGGLAAGVSVTLTVTADVLDPVGAGIHDFTNTASVTDDGGNGPDPTPADNTDSDTDTLDAAPDLQLTIDDGGISTMPDDTVVYTLDYTNVGDQDATGVVLTQNLPANTTFDLANSTAGWVDQGGGVYTFDLGNLDAGDAGSVSGSRWAGQSILSGRRKLHQPESHNRKRTRQVRCNR